MKTINIQSCKSNWQVILLLLLLTIGLLLQFSEVIDWKNLLDGVRQYSDNYSLIFAIIIIQIILFMLALPGSGMLWITAALYQPVIATTLLTIGTTFGALAAYWLAGRVQSPWLTHLKKHRLFENLKKTW